MENSDLIKVILTSSLIAAILSAIVSAFVSIKLKSLDYRNEYFKKILEKRLDAYKFIETQIALLKNTVLDNDGLAFHQIFAYGEDGFHEYQKNLIVAMSYSMWINEKTTDYMEDLNAVFFKISGKISNQNDEYVSKIAKQHYHEISKLRKLLEDSVRNDLLNLHNLKNMKKSASSSRRLRKIEIED